MVRYSLVQWVIGIVLEATLLLRGRKGGFFRHFPLFYSYIVYYFCASLATLLAYWLRPDFYATSYWFCYLVTLLAEFAVLLEISDHIFAPYPIIRMLGRSITVVICSLFFAFYVLPSFLQGQPRGAFLLDFSLWTSLTKVAIITVLIAIARFYGLKLGRNVAGLIAGFALYLGVYMVNFAAAQTFGKTIYADVLRFVGPFGSILCLAVWTATMWGFQLVPSPAPRPSETRARTLEEIDLELAQFNNALVRLLRK
jgi:hypothetical protein